MKELHILDWDDKLVSELIEELQKLPADTKIVHSSEGQWEDYQEWLEFWPK